MRTIPLTSTSPARIRGATATPGRPKSSSRLRGAQEPAFEQQLERLSPCDLLLVEGFKFAAIPKLEVWRAATGEALLHPNDPHIVAVASDGRIETKLQWLHLDDHPGIENFIVKYLKLA